MICIGKHCMWPWCHCVWFCLATTVLGVLVSNVYQYKSVFKLGRVNLHIRVKWVPFFESHGSLDQSIGKWFILLKTATAYSEWGSEHLSTSDCYSSDIILHSLLSERIFVGEEVKKCERQSSVRVVWVVCNNNDEDIFAVTMQVSFGL